MHAWLIYEQFVSYLTHVQIVYQKEGAWPGNEAIEHESRYYYKIVSDLVYTFNQ